MTTQLRIIGYVKRFIFADEKVCHFALLHHAGRPPNRRNLNKFLRKTAIGDKSVGSLETGNGNLAYVNFRVPSFSGTRNLPYARIPFPVSHEPTEFSPTALFPRD